MRLRKGEGDTPLHGFSALQRAEIAEIRPRDARLRGRIPRFSALQRAEIAEIDRETRDYAVEYRVSVLFNEPKLLKFF